MRDSSSQGSNAVFVKSSCLLGPQLKQAVTPGAGALLEPASPWQDLSGELVCEVAKWLLPKPVDAAALSHTSKNGCTAAFKLRRAAVGRY